MDIRCSKCGSIPPRSEWENTLAGFGMHLRHKREFCKKDRQSKRIVGLDLSNGKDKSALVTGHAKGGIVVIEKIKTLTPKRQRRAIQLFEYETITRPAVFTRAKGRCEEEVTDLARLASCGQAGTVPHHIHRRDGDHLVDVNNIIVLCDYHHKEAHRNLSISRPRHDEIRRNKP